MAKKEKRAKKATKSESGLWIAPRYSLKTTAKQVFLEASPGNLPPNRLIELADTALALWEHAPNKSLHRPKMRRSA